MCTISVTKTILFNLIKKYGYSKSSIEFLSYVDVCIVCMEEFEISPSSLQNLSFVIGPFLFHILRMSLARESGSARSRARINFTTHI
jgi:hypothetical protein